MEGHWFPIAPEKIFEPNDTVGVLRERSPPLERRKGKGGRKGGKRKKEEDKKRGGGRGKYHPDGDGPSGIVTADEIFGAHHKLLLDQ